MPSRRLRSPSGAARTKRGELPPAVRRAFLNTPGWIALCAAISMGAYVAGKRSQASLSSPARPPVVSPLVVAMPISADEDDDPEDDESLREAAECREVSSDEEEDDEREEGEGGGVYIFGADSDDEEEGDERLGRVDELAIDEDEEVISYAHAGPAAVEHVPTPVPMVVPFPISGSACGSSTSPGGTFADPTGLAAELAGLPFGSVPTPSTATGATTLAPVSGTATPVTPTVPGAAPDKPGHRDLASLYVEVCGAAASSDGEDGKGDAEPAQQGAAPSGGLIGDPPVAGTMGDGTPVPVPPKREGESSAELVVALAEALGLPEGTDVATVCASANSPAMRVVAVVVGLQRNDNPTISGR